jgi:hypothetical protein
MKSEINSKSRVELKVSCLFYQGETEEFHSSERSELLSREVEVLEVP